MSTKTVLLYLFIALAGIAVGVLATLAFIPPSSSAGHSADDGHGHGAVASATIASGEASDWCTEHRVPESQCTRCNPDLIAQFKSTADWCPEHGLPESHCRLCNPDIHFPQEPLIVETPEMFVSPDVYFPANADKCETDRAVIQFASAETIQRAGLSLEPALGSSQSGTVLDIPAELVFDETRTKMLTLAIPATVTRWLVEPGRNINTTTGICEADSPEMARLQSEYLETLSEWKVDQLVTLRADSLFAGKLISTAEYEEITGEAAMTMARLNGILGQLHAAGMSDSQIERIATAGISAHWTVEAGINGSLLERRAALGMQLQPGSAIALVGDPQALWVQAHVRERDAARVSIGLRIEFAADGAALDRAYGEVSWVAQFVDPQTRTVMVRARVQSSGDLGRANRFGRMLISADHAGESVMIPKDAVQWEGCCNVVFVADAGFKFRPRKVVVARGDRTHYRVDSGINAGEMIVVDGSYLLKTELMKGSMGTGCCGLEPEK